MKKFNAKGYAPRLKKTDKPAKKKQIGVVCVLHGTFTGHKKCPVCAVQANATITLLKPGDKALANEDRWHALVRMIQEYADAQEADSWKGGSDPEDMPVREAELKLARIQLQRHIEKMRSDLEGRSQDARAGSLQSNRKNHRKG